MYTCAKAPDSSPTHSSLQTLQGQGLRASFLLFLSIQVKLHTCQAGEPVSQDHDNQTSGKGSGRRRKEQSVVRVSEQEEGWLSQGRSPLLPFPSPWRSKASCQASPDLRENRLSPTQGHPKVQDGVPHLVLWLEPFQGTQGPELAMASSGQTAGAQGGRQGLGGCENPTTLRGGRHPMKKAVKVTRWKLPWTGEAPGAAL